MLVAALGAAVPSGPSVSQPWFPEPRQAAAVGPGHAAPGSTAGGRRTRGRRRGCRGVLRVRACPPVRGERGRRRGDRGASAGDEAGSEVGGRPGRTRRAVRATEPGARVHRDGERRARDQCRSRRGEPRAGIHLRELRGTRPERHGARFRPGGLPPTGPRPSRAIPQGVQRRHVGRRAPDDRQAADVGVGVRQGDPGAAAVAGRRAVAAAGRGHAGAGVHGVRASPPTRSPCSRKRSRSSRGSTRRSRRPTRRTTAGPMPRAPTNRRRTRARETCRSRRGGRSPC